MAYAYIEAYRVIYDSLAYVSISIYEYGMWCYVGDNFIMSNYIGLFSW